jgi:predicted RNase H-like nuclease (RuvC/YqgF family)
MSQEELTRTKEQLKYKTAEAMVSNNKVGEYVGKLMDAETKLLLFSEENKVLKEKLDEHNQIKADLNEKNKRVHSQETNNVALKDKLIVIKKQHQAELEHHGKVIDDLQLQLKGKEKMIETMGDELKILKGSKKKRSKAK